MRESALRLLAGHYIVESAYDNKLKLLEWAEYADKDQLYYFLKTGKRVREVPIQEQISLLQEDHYEGGILGAFTMKLLSNPIELLKLLTTRGPTGGLQGFAQAGAVAGISGTLLALAAFKAIKLLHKKVMSQGEKVCAGKTGEDKDACMKKIEQSAKAKQFSYLQRTLPLCSKTKNKEKCVSDIKAKMTKLKA